MPSLYPGNNGADATTLVAIFPGTQVPAAAFGLVGASFDRSALGIESFVACVSVGAPDAGTFTVDGKLQDSADNSTFADVAVNPQNTKVALTQMTTNNKVQHIEIDARGLRRYVRMVFTITVPGGTKVGFQHEFLTGSAMIAPGGGVAQ